MMSLHDSLIVLGMSSDTFALSVRIFNQIDFNRIFFGILFVNTKVNGCSDTYGWIRKALDYLQWGVRTFRHFRCCGSNTQSRHCKSFSNVLEYLIPVIEREHIT